MSRQGRRGLRRQSFVDAPVVEVPPKGGTDAGDMQLYLPRGRPRDLAGALRLPFGVEAATLHLGRVKRVNRLVEVDADALELTAD